MKIAELKKHIYPQTENALVPQSDYERQFFRESVVKQGILEPVKLAYVAEIDNLALVDGHHRVKLADELGIEEVKHEVIEQRFDNFYSVKQWALSEQLGRRNLDQKEYLLYLAHVSRLEKLKQIKLENSNKQDVSAKIAKEADVPKQTIHRYEAIDKKLEAIEQITGDAKAKQAFVSEAITEAELEVLAQATEEKPPRVAKQVIDSLLAEAGQKQITHDRKNAIASTIAEREPERELVVIQGRTVRLPSAEDKERWTPADLSALDAFLANNAFVADKRKHKMLYYWAKDEALLYSISHAYAKCSKAKERMMLAMALDTEFMQSIASQPKVFVGSGAEVALELKRDNALWLEKAGRLLELL